MDGMTDPMRPLITVAPQQTLKTPISCVGIGLHSGKRVHLSLLPAAPNTGIIFRRTDLGVEIPATYASVVDTRLCTQISTPAHPEARVGTVEHLMAALAAAGVDNAIVALDGAEVPVFDGSAAPYLFLIDCAGVQSLSTPRTILEVLRTVRVDAGDAFAELRPGPAILDMSVSIDFPAAAIGKQALSLPFSGETFRACLAHARTFTQLAEIEGLQAAGLARGGSLKNAIVVDGARVLNPEGLRQSDEFVRHKMLDAVGDLALAGAPLRGRFVAHKTGHALNNKLLRALFADRANWAYNMPELAGRSYGFVSAHAA